MGHRTWVHSDRITAGTDHDTLYIGEFISSPNGKYHLEMQGDGNVVLYKSWLWVPENAMWDTVTYGADSGPFYFVMQSDYNLCLYDAKKKCLWASTYQWYGADLRLENDGRLRMYSEDGKKVVWEPSVKTIETPCNVKTFDETVMPQFAQAIVATNSLQDGLLAAKDVKDIKEALDAHVLAIGANLQSALNANYALLKESEAHIAATLILQKGLVEAKDAAKANAGKLDEKIKALEKTINEQSAHYDQCRDALYSADRDYSKAKNDYDSARRDYETKKKLAIAFFWLPIVSISLGIAAAVSDKDVSNAKTLLDTRRREADLAGKRLDESRNRLNDLRNSTDDSENQLLALQVRAKGLDDDTQALKAERVRLADLDVKLKEHASRIGLAYGSAKVLELQSSGRLTLRPLTTTIVTLLQQVVESNLVSDRTAKKMLEDAEMLDKRIPQFQQLNEIERNKELDKFIL